MAADNEPPQDMHMDMDMDMAWKNCVCHIFFIDRFSDVAMFDPIGSTTALYHTVRSEDCGNRDGNRGVRGKPQIAPKCQPQRQTPSQAQALNGPLNANRNAGRPDDRAPRAIKNADRCDLCDGL